VTVFKFQSVILSFLSLGCLWF